MITRRGSQVYFRSCLFLSLALSPPPSLSLSPLSLSFSLPPTLLPSPRRVLQPVAPVLFAIYISCYAPMTNASVVLASRQSRSLQKKKEKGREGKKERRKEENRETPPAVCVPRASNYLEYGKTAESLHAILWIPSRKKKRERLLANTLNYRAIFRFSR